VANDHKIGFQVIQNCIIIGMPSPAIFAPLGSSRHLKTIG
jgi:hypothetical protein